MKNTGYLLAISRGHNAGAVLLKDGEIVFAIEEERLTRRKWDGGPYKSIVKTLEYTDKIDALIIAHTQLTKDSGHFVDFTGDELYTGMCRKFGLIDDVYTNKDNPHPQVIDLAGIHHKLHAACAFYRSGFDKAVGVVVDGAGTFFSLSSPAGMLGEGGFLSLEVESIFNCDYPYDFRTLYKHCGTNTPMVTTLGKIELEDPLTGKEDVDTLISDGAGITKTYEAVSQYCGFQAIEAGKTMGLFSYGEPNENIPPLFIETEFGKLSNKNLVRPDYPQSSLINHSAFKELAFSSVNNVKELPTLKNRKDLAYALQTQTQEEVIKLIRKAVEISGRKDVVVSGGYGLNCVANYEYLDALKDEGINLYVEPISNDAGTAIGAAYAYYHWITGSREKHKPDMYLGPDYKYADDYIKDKVNSNIGVELKENVTYNEVVDLITNKNLVTIFQGKSENGPRALGNRSILYDPTDPNGKDFVNEVKRREWFRPFAGSILAEDVHEWFDLRGMNSSPHMMYAVNCKPGIKEKIPSIIHVDDTCRIQTVTEEENPHYYNLIKAFKEKTGVPIIFNTSFNLGGDPLVETIDDAITTLTRSNIEYMYLPENNMLIKVPNKSIHPA